MARFGGDEFAMFRPGMSGPNEASALASYLVDAVGRPFLIEGHTLEIATSIGVAMSPGDGASCDLLLKSADMALYRAKEEGRRAFRFFEPEMDARAQARRLLETDLRRALGAGEFELYYQPLVSLKTGAITGFEALMRWHHPTRGMVPPAEFIPLSEEIGLIVPLGEWALRQACAEAVRWPGDLKVAVNLSSIQFKAGNVIYAVLTALANSGLPASRLWDCSQLPPLCWPPAAKPDVEKARAATAMRGRKMMRMPPKPPAAHGVVKSARRCEEDCCAACRNG